MTAEAEETLRKRKKDSGDTVDGDEAQPSKTDPATEGTKAPPDEVIQRSKDLVGAMARIDGLKQGAALNGKLCKVLRLADGAGRVIVDMPREGGEKSLKVENLEGGAAIFPQGAEVVAGIFLLLVCSFVADVTLNPGDHFVISAAAMPILFAQMLLTTAGLCYTLNLQVSPPGTWVVTLSEASAAEPLKDLYRMGSLGAGLLLAASVWLYSEVVMPQIAAVAAAGDASATEGQAQVKMPAEASGWGYNDADPIAESPLAWMPETCQWWGYLAALGLGAQAIAPWGWSRGRYIQSVLYVIGQVAFVVGAYKFIQQSSFVMASMRGRPLTSTSQLLKMVVHFRLRVLEFGPAVVLTAPASYKLLFSKWLEPVSRTKEGVMEALGVKNTIACAQWGMIVVITTCCCTYTADLLAAQGLKA
eukprot:TRINITY_DN41805_c0_g1_i2.p1 TRINITY_DN41805_c0_g1~~TRINITY_DN41805_c0_g1_i2.p1  ORF type:complete len:439 (-),score=82.23 TRINITY_DN41805_c0_g1_i2:322-1572(-)